MKLFSIQFNTYESSFTGWTHFHVVQADTREEAASKLSTHVGLPAAYLLERGTIEEVTYENGILDVGTVFFDG